MEEKVAKLILIRHSEIDPVYKGRYIGRTDAGLSRQGIRQARAMGKSLQNGLSGCFVFVSPALRCRETWQEMAHSVRHKAVFWDDLHEVDFGDWEGKRFAEIKRFYPNEVIRWKNFESDFGFPRGESLRQFSKRMKKLRKKILSLKKKKVALITHQGVITFLICIFLGLNLSRHLLFRVAQPSISSVEIFHNGKGVLTSLNQSLENPWPE